MAELNSRLAETLTALAPVLADLQDDWWLFGSAAMILQGAGPIEAGDVDLLVSRQDAVGLFQRLGLLLQPGTKSDRFHSEIFGRWTAPALDVDILAGFRVRSGGTWHEVRPNTREPKQLLGSIFYVPSIEELIEYCRLFDRPKDHAREPLLKALL